MSLFNFNQEEIMSFFGVMVRFSVLFAILPFIGDRFIPTPVKILLALSVSIALFPALVASGQIRPGDAAVWGATPSGIIGTIAMEVLLALILGFTARLVFDGLNFGANLVGNFMGFAAASTYDPHRESQTGVVAEIQMSLAMLLFLAVDGHHLMLRSSLESYKIVGLGGHLLLGKGFSDQLIHLSGEVVRIGVLLSAPVAVSLFGVNVAFGIMSKTMPQLNVLVLSFGVSALIGLIVLFLSIPEFHGVVLSVIGNIGKWMDAILLSLTK